MVSSVLRTPPRIVLNDEEDACALVDGVDCGQELKGRGACEDGSGTGGVEHAGADVTDG